jgi:sporulation protein YlmC with PRC-barrel domain
VRKVIALSAVAGLFAATAAMSQTTDQMQTQPQAAPPATTGPQDTSPPVGTPPSPQAQPETTPKAPSPGQRAFLSQQQQDQMLASNLMRQSILGANNERIGDVNDLLLSKDGQVEAVLVGVGGFLGIGEKIVAIPFSALKPSSESNQLTAPYSREELEQAPEFVTLQREGTGTSGGTGTTGGGGMGTQR